jgi:mycothiol synthase
MITYAWRSSFAPEEETELREMLAAAAAEDAEAGFPAVSLDQPYRDDASHLVVRLLPDQRAGHEGSSPVAAYLRVEPDPYDGPATVWYVVRPEFRSRGISTLLVESLGLDMRTDGGWAGTGAAALRIWANGDHPAAQRMARRFECFGVRSGHRQWQLLAPLRNAGLPDSPGSAPRPPASAPEQAAVTVLWRRDRGGPEEPPDHAEVLVAGPDVAGAVWYDPHADERTEYGTAGRIIAVLAAPGQEKVRAELVAAAMAALQERGLRVAAIAVDADDHVLARGCRLLGFRHDRTDIEYTVGAPAAADGADVTQAPAEVTR